MKKFSYVAQDAKGKQVKGTITAEDEKAFLKIIQEKGLYCQDYKESSTDNTQTTYKFKVTELAFMCRQLSAMLTSGLTLVKSIDILKDEMENEKAKAIWLDIYENVQKGESFSDSLKRYDSAFPTFLVAMITAGESSGSLDIIMSKMSEYYAGQNKIKNVIKGALTYPIILAVLCVVIVMFLFIFIMPTFIDMYEDPSKMPVLTKILAAISDFLKTKWYLLIIIVAALVFGGKYALKNPDIRLKFDRLKVKGPGFGPLVTKIYTGRFASTLSSLYSSGIPMVECLEKSSDVLDNAYISKKFEDVVDEVKQGETLSGAITRTEIFESMFCSVIYVGEESGALDTILQKTAEYYEEESSSAVQRLVGMVEPILLIFMGLVIGMVVAGIYPALYGSMEGIENE